MTAGQAPVFWSRENRVGLRRASARSHAATALVPVMYFVMNRNGKESRRTSRVTRRRVCAGCVPDASPWRLVVRLVQVVALSESLVAVTRRMTRAVDTSANDGPGCCFCLVRGDAPPATEWRIRGERKIPIGGKLPGRLRHLSAIARELDRNMPRRSSWRREVDLLDFELPAMFFRQLAGRHCDLEHAVFECGFRFLRLDAIRQLEWRDRRTHRSAHTRSTLFPSVPFLPSVLPE